MSDSTTPKPHDHGHDHDHHHGHAHGHDHSHDHGAAHTHDQKPAHDHGHAHGHSHGAPASPRRRVLRWAVAGGVLVVALLLASVSTVEPGQAIVVTRLGRPVSVHLQPGAYWHAPPPIDQAERIDLRLSSTDSGIITTPALADGSIFDVELAIDWRVRADDAAVLAWLAAAKNNPQVMIGQLRSTAVAALREAASGYTRADLLGGPQAAKRLDELGERIRSRVAEKLEATYGIQVQAVAVQRLMWAQSVTKAVQDARKAELEVLATKRRLEGQAKADALRSAAQTEADIARAKAKAEAAATLAQAEKEAGEIYGQAYQTNRTLYEWERRLSSLEASLGSDATVVLTTDADPFQILLRGPGNAAGAQPPPPPPPAGGAPQAPRPLQP